MTRAINEQLNYAAPTSIAIRMSTRVREAMFHMFMDEFHPSEQDSVLDVGVTSDQTYENSNYFEGLYPYKSQIVAAGLQDAAFLERLYPGVRYIEANALDLPFGDASFDFVHSSAVLEHVGSFENQARMIAECVRVARRGVCLTTPNRWFPIEFHTQLPLVHWMPKSMCRYIFRIFGFEELSYEENLNLMTRREILAIIASLPRWTFRVASPRLFGWKSNLIFFGHARE